MDPDCAICSKPAHARCDCEAKGLDMAVRQAEQRMMTAMFSEIRTWVRGHAQDYILSYFGMLTTRRKNQHQETIQRMTDAAAYYYQALPHPQEVAQADAQLKRGIDDDWKASVQRYPEVLEYFYGLVNLSLPPASDPSIRDPPLSALNGGLPQRERKVRLREPSERERLPPTSRRRERDRDDRDRTPAPERPPTRGGERSAGGGRAGDRRSMGGGGVAYAPMPVHGGGISYGYVPAGGY